MLIEIHMLKNYGPANLNRDDTNAPKTCMFGGVPRARISSQCLKRSWRTSELFREEIGSSLLGIRTRKLPDLVGEELTRRGLSDKEIEGVKKNLTGIGNKNSKETEDGKTKQIILYSPEDITVLADTIERKLKNGEKISTKDLEAELKKDSKRSLSVDMALFGRMVTSDAFADVEASMQVAHAVSTNKVYMESDYFTAVDDLIFGGSDDSGSAMIGDVDYNSSCYYIYGSVDTAKLMDNLSGHENAKEITNALIKTLIKTMAFANPSGKQNTFAAHSLPSAILIECKDVNIPVSYINGFEEAAYASREGGLIFNSIRKLAKEVQKIQEGYGLPVCKRLWFNTEGITLKLSGTEVCTSLMDMLERLPEV